MSPLEILQLVGYTTAAALHLWVAALLLKRRNSLGKLERVLMNLAWVVGIWHACNLFLLLHSMLGFEVEKWKTFLRLTNSLAVITITLAYSLLLHSHLYLWANSKKRTLTRGERIRVFLSYLPAAFLTVAVWKLWKEPYGPMYQKLDFLLLPFALWAVYCLGTVAAVDLLIARSTSSTSERRLLKTLAASFVGIAALIFSVYIFKAGRGTEFGQYLQAFANLGSLVPTALLAYHIYRYRYLELIIKESLIVATLAAVVLVVYVFGVRTLASWVTTRYELRAGILESILILTLALVAAPLRNWLDRRFHQLFEREAALYRDVVTGIGAGASSYSRLKDLLNFFEERIRTGLDLRRVKIVALNHPNESDNDSDKLFLPVKSGDDDLGKRVDDRLPASQMVDDKTDRDEDARKWVDGLIVVSATQGYVPVEGVAPLRARGFEIAFPLRREDRNVGLLLIDAPPDSLNRDVLSVLEILAGQIAIAIEDFRLVAENIKLERQLAQRERLAALGQMAATVAHEIKNPLSSIKSIVQVMREDERISRDYSRDLSLIIGETDRLSRSVTQMLSFARNTTPVEHPQRVDVLINSIVQLFQAEAGARNIEIKCETNNIEAVLDGASVSALRDAFSNLLLNALQVTGENGTVEVETRMSERRLVLSVTDEGAGVADNMREKIWEPFFTTKQRGTGLGLAIVRKRIQEIGGTAKLASNVERGARFELIIPLNL